MAERWVVNASPLIVLAKIDQQQLLLDLAESLVVPQAVVDEINAGPPDDPARRFLSTGRLPVVAVEPDLTILAWDLGAGESAVLSYALAHAGWTAVVDDGMARRCARTLSIPLLGTLGVILRARRAGIIPAAAPVLRAVQAVGLRLDDEVIRTALAQTVGEVW
jgi:predicted nucleic acid-binding protein